MLGISSAAETGPLSFPVGSGPAVDGTKNETRLAALTGTWTIDSTIESSFGLYKVRVSLVMYLTGDPLRQNTCQLDGCSELNSSFCMLNDRSTSKTCGSMAHNVSDWSDVVGYLYFGVTFELGAPFFVHESQDTGGWIGPLSVVMAKNFTETNSTRTVSDAIHSSNRVVVDRYETRYLQTPSSPYIRFNPNCTLLSYDDFDNYFGSRAVINTAKVQSTANNGSSVYDPFLKTCDNGDLKPILPLAQFEFVVDKETGKESIDIDLDYKMLTIPDPTWNRWMPALKRKGLPVSGPYCYGGELRGWVLDLPYKTEKKHRFARLLHDCVEGLPCRPISANLIPTNTAIEIHDRPGTTTIDVSGLFYTSTVIVILFAILITLMVKHVRLSRSYSRCRRIAELDRLGGAQPSMEMEQHNMQQLNMQQLKNGRKGRHALDGLVSEGNSFDKLSTPLLEDGGRSEGMPLELPPESGTQNDLTTSMVSV